MLINSLDDARRAVAAAEGLTLCMADLDKWGLSPQHSFL